ncbi:hypothetical protein DB48_19165 [Shewanella sp. cp20]|nr:hypothetical protein DB48_19165 [Shewanella sp. cp20]
MFRSLSRYNYFPNQKQSIGELPDCFSTSKFTPEVCLKLLSGGISKSRKRSGFAPVEFKSTRYNNIPRILSLVHPVAHAQLCLHIRNYWNEIEYISDNESSRVRPQFYEEDRRIIIMNYDDPIVKDRKHNIITFGKKYLVKADIANCFDSIYSHSLSWAIVGYDHAKTTRDPQLWFNKFDKYLSTTKRCETNGMPVGPATSSICLEIILARIDSKLKAQGFEHERYVDDFCCYCSTKEQAEKFIIKLSEFLAEYRLSLNLRKTSIVDLPISSTDDWVVELNHLCMDRYNDNGELIKCTSKEALNIINKALILSKSHKDGSVIKFSVSSIVKKLEDSAYQDVFECLLSLSFYYPILIPYLSILLDKGKLDVSRYICNINMIISENAIHNRSDGMAWPLHIFRENDIEPTEDIIEQVLATKDCVSITILQDICPGNEKIREFVVNVSSDVDIKKDEYWLLLYQSFLRGDISNPYDERCFDVLKEYGVTFFKSDISTKSENKCDSVDAVWAFNLFESMPLTNSA